MPEEKNRTESIAAKSATPLPQRVREFVFHAWRPAVSTMAVMLALLLTWHVINGRNGISAWRQKRSEDRQLQNDIRNLEQENGQLRNRIEHLKSDPDAIEHEAREKLHYAKPGEVIYALPSQQSASGK
jgi:cell division protein FtsB